MKYILQVEGSVQVEYDTIKDAVSAARKRVYAGQSDLQRAHDDLGAGRFAEWSYGFSAVRIYPQGSAA